jgi:hypothetical protein
VQVTKFYVGDPAGTPVASNTIALTVTTPRLALYAEQTAPGEDCVATLTEMGGAGEAAIRIRGELESAGANVMLLDRSWSMERSLLGVGSPAASDQARVAAMRQAVASLLSAVTMVPAPGPWAFLPFTTDVQATLTTPASGFSSTPAVSNPDNPGGMKVIGFGGATSDTLDPGGPGNLVQAMRSGLTRLASADQLAPSPGAERRLWVLTDGSSGTAGYGTFATLLPSMLRGNVSLHLLGAGALENDPLMQQMVSLSSHLTGEHLFGPALGQLGIAHTKIAFVENTLTTMVRSLLRGRPVGTISRGSLTMGQNMQNTFHLTKDKTTGLTDQWALHVLMFEDADATVQLQVFANGSTAGPRCLRVPNAIVCAAVGYDGDYKVIASGSRPGGAPTLAVLRSYVSSALNGGEVGFFPSFARSLNRSGDQVRVQLLLTERGMPLRGATVSAKITGPNAAIGNIVAQGSAGQSDINNLISQSGDLSPGQAKGELLDPMSVPALRPLPPINLVDDATNGDFEPQDGVYTGQFNAFVPGVYLIDIHADYNGQLGNAGTIEDRLVTQVVVGMDQTLTDGTERSVALSTGGIRLRFTPQDAGKNLLGPGQAAALSFAQGSKAFAPVVSDYLDGSYRADVTGIDPTQPFDLVGPGTRVQIWSPDSGGGGMSSGCSASASVGGGVGASGPGAASLLALVGVATLVRRRRPHRA